MYEAKIISCRYEFDPVQIWTVYKVGTLHSILNGDARTVLYINIDKLICVDLKDKENAKRILENHVFENRVAEYDATRIYETVEPIIDIKHNIVCSKGNIEYKGMRGIRDGVLCPLQTPDATPTILIRNKVPTHSSVIHNVVRENTIHNVRVTHYSNIIDIMKIPILIAVSETNETYEVINEEVHLLGNLIDFGSLAERFL